MALTTFRHFCAASRVLDVYLDSTASLLVASRDFSKKLNEAVALSMRSEQVFVPDHQHRNRIRNTFRDSANLADMLLTALGAADEAGDAHCLEIDGEQLFVRAGQLEDWQREVTACQSPVPIMAAKWARHCRELGHTEAVGMKLLCSSLTHSSLPGINDRRLNNLIQNCNGNGGNLCDLHIHINGASEFTSVWLHSLAHPERTYKALCEALHAEKARVEFFHHQLRTDPSTVRRRLYMANVLRGWLCRLLQSHGNPATEGIPTLADVVGLLKGHNGHAGRSLYHPFKHALVPQHATALQREAAMWLHALYLLRETKSHLLAVLMHLYLLIMHQHLRLMVHQPEQYGFDQFQYITLAGAREALEGSGSSGFATRFQQFYGMYGPDMAHVEARFAPKSKPEKMYNQLTSIWKGYQAAMGCHRARIAPCAGCPRIAREIQLDKGTVQYCGSAVRKGFSLGLVAHFIKKGDAGNGACRHGALRDDLARQAQSLVRVKESLRHGNPELYAALVGKDAASNELDAPPEVFAPIFRYLNREGISHTTYHAGEDFGHILCGVRATHEAITFLGLRNGDRIGHATAIGIDPQLCKTQDVRCPQGQWLDNLIWLTHRLCTEDGLALFRGEVALLQAAIARLYVNIYGKECPQLPVLWKAWALRAYDLRDINREYEPVHRYSKEERNLLLKEQQAAGIPLFNAACDELRLYHKHRHKWNAIIEVRPEDQPRHELLQAVQDAVVREMRAKNILVEVLPTSNVRISHYASTDEHHVMRWLDPHNSRPAPQVVIGTDDPGIFSTTLRNEYSFILNKLQDLYPGCNEKPYEVIHHLIENGRSYRFFSEKKHS